ncbi:MAG: DUF1932 domain-containing protein [Acidimicrobiales bacterium]
MTRFAVLGLGEAGSEIASDLAVAGAEVWGFDPASVPDPAGVNRVHDPGTAVAAAEVVLAVTAASDATMAMQQCLDRIPTQTLYADLSTAAPALKRELGSTASERGIRFVDIALMSTVPDKGVRTPALASGAGAADFVSTMVQYGMPVEFAGDEPGQAAARKLIRSVAVKGIAAVVIEAMHAANEAGLAESTWQNLATEFTNADETFLRRLVEGTSPHALRRKAEMEAAVDLLGELGVEAAMTRATVASLDSVLAHGVPELPDPD